MSIHTPEDGQNRVRPRTAREAKRSAWTSMPAHCSKCGEKYIIDFWYRVTTDGAKTDKFDDHWSCRDSPQ